MKNWQKQLKDEFGIHFKNSSDELQFLEVFIEDLLKEQRQEIEEDLQTVIHMLEGSTATREQIANYIKRYLLKD